MDIVSQMYIEFVGVDSPTSLAQTGDVLVYILIAILLAMISCLILLRQKIFANVGITKITSSILYFSFAACIIFAVGAFVNSAFAQENNNTNIHVNVDKSTGEYNISDGALILDASGKLNNYKITLQDQSFSNIKFDLSLNGKKLSQEPTDVNKSNIVSANFENLDNQTAKSLINKKFALIEFNISLVPGGEILAETELETFKQITYKDQNLTDYNIRKAMLEKDGYTLYDSNTLNNNLFATYTKDKQINHIYYTPNNNQIREITGNNVALPPKTVQPYKSICDETASIVKIVNKDDSQCCVYRLVDGTFILMDSNAAYRKEPGICIKEIYNCLEKLAPDKNNIVIRNWNFSHPHEDHTGGFVEFCDHLSEYQNIHIESISYNFAGTKEQYKHTRYNSYLYDQFDKAVKEHFPNTTIYRTLTGQVLHYPGADMQVLYTYNDFAPMIMGEETDDDEARAEAAKGLGDGNLESSVIRIISKSTDKTFLNTADIGEYNLKEIVKRYDSNVLHGDLMTIPHHGHDQDRYRARNGNRQFYDLVNPTAIFWPCSTKHAEERCHATDDQYTKRRGIISYINTEYIYNKCKEHCYISGTDTYTLRMKDLALL